MGIDTVFARKVDASVVSSALDTRIPGDGTAVLIHDGYDDIDRSRNDQRLRFVIDARLDKPEVLNDLHMDVVVVYACTQDDLGLPFVEHLHRTGRRYFPVWSARPGGYIFTNTKAREVLSYEFEFQKREGFAKWDFGYHDFANLIQALELVRELPGCYVEVGCYRGSSAGIVLRYLAAVRRPMPSVFLDVFNGFTYEEANSSADSIWCGTHVTEGIDSVRQRLLSYGAEFPEMSITVEVNNIITDPLPPIVVEHGIAVANLDVDLHEAVYAGLHKLAPHIVKSGIIVVEDAGHTPLLIGAKHALEKFLAEEVGKQFIHLVMESGQSFLIKK
jgi:hypothetical protein